MDVQVSLGHVINMTISFLDQNGNPMLVDPKVDSAPVWSNLSASVETVVASPDGMKAVATPVSIGADSVNVAAVIGGKPFTANLAVNVTPVAQVLTSIGIVPEVV